MLKNLLKENKINKKLKINLIIIFSIILLAVPHSVSNAVSTIYYVSPSGSNSNPGTSTSQPWQTIQYAVDHVSAGDVIYVRAGTYNESVGIHLSGQTGNPITLSGYQNETAVIDAGTSIAVYDSGNHEYIVIQNLTIKSAGRFTLRIGWWGDSKSSNYWTVKNNKITGANIIRGHHNVFENNDINGTGYTQDGSGIQDIQEVSYSNLYKNNSIHDFTANTGRGIWLESRSHDDIVDGNTIWNITGGLGQCIDIDDYGNVGWGHTIRNNTVWNCGYVGIQIENGWNNLVENNKISDSKAAGIIIINYGSGECEVGGDNNQYGDTNLDGDCRGDTTENMIRQNLIVNSGTVGAIVSYYVGGVHVLNNTIYNAQSVGLFLHNTYTKNWDVRGNIFANSKRAEISGVDLSSMVQDDYNLFYNANSSRIYEMTSNSSTYSLATYKTTFKKGMHSIQADPQFTDPANSNFQLKTTSPAVDRGIDSGLLVDFMGNPRPQGNGFDIGIFELNTSGSTPLPTPVPKVDPADYDNLCYIPLIIK